MARGQLEIYAALRQRIVAGVYGPGVQLREEPLAREFGLSRTPVRAALKRLIDDGLATADIGQGVHVAPWTDHDITEILQLRMLLEPHAVRLATSNGRDTLVVQLEEHNAAMAEALDAPGGEGMSQLHEINRAFHMVIAAAAGAPRLLATLTTMIEVPVINRSYDLSSLDERRQSLRHHREITAAIAMGDGELAASIMHVHLRTAFARFMQRRSSWGTRAKVD